MLIFLFQLFYQNHKYRLIFDTVSLQISVCAFNYSPREEYLDLFIVVALSSKSFSGKTSVAVKNSYLLMFPERNLNSLSP